MFTWCGQGAGHHPADHTGAADMSPAIATGRRYESEMVDNGVTVPEVVVHLRADLSAGDPPAELTVRLTINKPDGEHSDVELTLREADYLRRHLVQVLAMAVDR
ncbi:hypothetical protein NPS01_42810 [Nocardioides psychrotolerans]|nr:hypothetical protein [Nocardioides psychrotolerans]GEP40618.1 hypothetical protein NPS01_42810 [Nocardioides psychrotolerans]